MGTSYDEIVALIRAGLAHCDRSWYRDLALELDPDATADAEQLVAHPAGQEGHFLTAAYTRKVGNQQVGILNVGN
jgi:hypothetical protein